MIDLSLVGQKYT